MDISEIKDAIKRIEDGLGSGPWEIYVLTYGWVIAGKPREVHKGAITLGEAYVVRRWGTSEGIGELAMKGKQENTQLDKLPPTKIREAQVIFSMSSADLA